VHFDLAVIGGGILGLAHALGAASIGKRVVVIERDERANGASIRNFGFVTVTGQQSGECWRRAMRSRDIWVEVARAAGIPVEHEGLCVAAHRPEARQVLEAFAATEMGAHCALLTPAQAVQRVPHLRKGALAGALWSPHELRVESRTAIPRLAAWLESAHGVVFHRSTHVRSVAPPRIETSRGLVEAGAAVVCPGHDFLSLFPERLAAYRLATCKLQMLRLTPAVPDWRLGAAVMSDLGLVRYPGYAELPEAAALRARLAVDEPEALAHGVHLIAVQSSDGSLVVGDSHHYGETVDPFALDVVDRLILGELERTVELQEFEVSARWTGTYASSRDRLMLIDRPADDVRIVIVTSGTGASTAFAIGEEVIGELYGPQQPRKPE
jgi:FAD dependent oxidoreductase TIGR03364